MDGYLKVKVVIVQSATATINEVLTVRTEYNPHPTLFPTLQQHQQPKPQTPINAGGPIGTTTYFSYQLARDPLLLYYFLLNVIS